MSPGMVDYQRMKPSFMAKIQQFKPHFYHIQQDLPRLSPGMPWPAATYVQLSPGGGASYHLDVKFNIVNNVHKNI